MSGSNDLPLLPLGRRGPIGSDEGFPQTSHKRLRTPHLPFGHLLPKGRSGSKLNRRLPICARSARGGEKREAAI